MYAIYKLSDNSKVSAFLWGDIMEIRKYTDAYQVDENGRTDQSTETEVEIHKDNDGNLFFIWNNEKIYFDNFEYMPINELVNKINNNEYVSVDDMLATFLKDTDNVGIVDYPSEYEMIIPGMGIGIVSGNRGKKPILCVPTEIDNYRKEDWHHKITITPENEELRRIYANETYYFLDLAGMLRSKKNIQLVNKNEYKLANPEKNKELCKKNKKKKK
jgi:hypothetical protein